MGKYYFDACYSDATSNVVGETQVVFWQNGTSVMAMARNVFNPDGGRIEIGGTGNIYNLVFREVRLGDEGSYTCQIPGGEGTIKQKNMLTVNSKYMYCENSRPSRVVHF